MARLNGWYRLAIVATIAWLLGGFLWFNSMLVEEARSALDFVFKNCVDAKSSNNDFDFSDCYSRFSADYEKTIQQGLWISAAASGAVAALAWIFAFLIMGVARWVRAGGFR